MSEPAPPASPLQTPDAWDSVAVGYAEELLTWTAYAEECLRLAGAEREHEVLDLGTGPGTLAFLAAKQVRRVTAIDFAPKMIEQLDARKTREGVDNLTAQVMDAQSLAFGDDSFDAVYSLFVFMFFPNRSRVFTEVRRVLRPGGKLILATWAPIDRRPLLQLGFEALSEALPDLPRPQKGDLQHPEECEGELESEGFVEVSARRFDFAVHVPSAERYLDMMIRTAAPFALIRKRLGEERWATAVQRMREALERRIPEDGVELGAEAILSIGTAP